MHSPAPQRVNGATTCWYAPPRVSTKAKPRPVTRGGGATTRSVLGRWLPPPRPQPRPTWHRLRLTDAVGIECSASRGRGCCQVHSWFCSSLPQGNTSDRCGTGCAFQAGSAASGARVVVWGPQAPPLRPAASVVESQVVDGQHPSKRLCSPLPFGSPSRPAGESVPRFFHGAAGSRSKYI